MAKAATLNIDIVAKADQALETFDKVKEKTEKAHAGMKIAAVAAAGAIFAGLTEATKAATEHEAGVAKLQQAYKNAGVPMGDMKGTLEEIEAGSRKTGQSAEDNIAAYTKLVTVTRDTAKAHTELATAQDLAAYKGISVADAATAIIQAQEGNTRSLKEMGIATKDASGKQLDAAGIMKNLTAAVHGQADAFGKTSAGEMARYQESLEQTKEKIGEALLPALKKILDMLQPLFSWLSNNTAIIKVLAPIIAIAAAAVVAITIAMKVWTAIQWALNIAMEANPIGLVIMAIVAIIAVVILVIKHWQTFKAVLLDVWGALRTFAGWIYGGIIAAWHGLDDAIHAVWGVLQAVGAWILGHWKLIVDVLLGPLGLIITNFQNIYNVIHDVIGALEAVGKAVSDALGWLGKLPSKAGGFLKSINPFGLPGGGGPAPTPLVFQIYATPGADLPETVYQALRDYQRRHVRPELAPMFGR